jgi:ABC-type bacteriocin/lantibiotic exporter with double-glycine peptidase domain
MKNKKVWRYVISPRIKRALVLPVLVFLLLLMCVIVIKSLNGVCLAIFCTLVVVVYVERAVFLNKIQEKVKKEMDGCEQLRIRVVNSRLALINIVNEIDLYTHTFISSKSAAIVKKIQEHEILMKALQARGCLDLRHQECWKSWEKVSQLIEASDSDPVDFSEVDISHLRISIGGISESEALLSEYLDELRSFSGLATA